MVAVKPFEKGDEAVEVSFVFVETINKKGKAVGALYLGNKRGYAALKLFESPVLGVGQVCSGELEVLVAS